MTCTPAEPFSRVRKCRHIVKAACNGCIADLVAAEVQRAVREEREATLADIADARGRQGHLGGAGFAGYHYRGGYLRALDVVEDQIRSRSQDTKEEKKP